MDKNTLFEKFIKSGKIEDYLRYKQYKNDGVNDDTRKRNSSKNN